MPVEGRRSLSGLGNDGLGGLPDCLGQPVETCGGHLQDAHTGEPARSGPEPALEGAIERANAGHQGLAEGAGQGLVHLPHEAKGDVPA